MVLFCSFLASVSYANSDEENQNHDAEPKEDSVQFLGNPSEPEVVSERFSVMLLPLGGLKNLDRDLFRQGLKAAGVDMVHLSQEDVFDVKRQRPRLDDVRSAILEAKAAYRRLEIERAEKILSKAHQAFYQSDSARSQKSVLVELLLLRAEISIASGNSLSLAQEDLLLAARLDPERDQLHPGLYPPSVVDAFANAKKVDETSSQGLIVLHLSQPALKKGELEFTLVVDGTPQKLPKGGGLALTRGPHFLHLSSASGSSKSLRVVVQDRPQDIFFFAGPNQAGKLRNSILQELLVAEEQSSNEEIGQQQMKVPFLRRLSTVSSASTYIWIEGHQVFAYDIRRGVAKLPTLFEEGGQAVGNALLLWQKPPLELAEIGSPPGDDVTIGEQDEGLPLWSWAIAVPGVGSLLVGTAVAGVSFWILSQQEPVKELPPPYSYVEVSCCSGGTRP
ncbi:MAG: hypothetical protein GY822_18315 [Deltaproteobacteria bacterium]|nr:hypothetical protein [Deltaproteobacteria bacterium]